MKTVHSFLLLFLCCCWGGQAQNNVYILEEDNDSTPLRYEWLGTDSRVLTWMKLAYKKPDGFNEIPETECFKK